MQDSNSSSILDYLAQHEFVEDLLCGKDTEKNKRDKSNWKAGNLSDGNMNYIYKVTGPAHTIIVKQAVPYVRVIGPSWPMEAIRAYYEYLTLQEEGVHVPQLVPKVYHYDPATYTVFMEYLDNHIIMRHGMIEGIKYPLFSDHITTFMAEMLFKTSDIFLNTADKRKKVATYSGNYDLCKLTEEPYHESKNNRWTKPYLDDLAQQTRNDSELKIKVTRLKHKFMTCTQALLHADLHTGSIMVNESSTKVIDPEFAFFGPMGFDVGAVIANLFLAYFSQTGLASNETSTSRNDSPNFREDYQQWILNTTKEVWEKFQEKFLHLWKTQAKGDLYQPAMFEDPQSIAALEKERITFMNEIFHDTLGFAGAKMVRRIFGVAHVLDMESIKNLEMRAQCETKAVLMGRELICNTSAYQSISHVISLAQRLLLSE